MFMPNLMPGDVHRLWMVHQKNDNNHGHRLNKTEIPEIDQSESMSSYTPAYIGALQHTASTKKIKEIIELRGGNSNKFGFNDEITTLDQISLELDTRLQLIKRTQYIGSNYIKPIGLDKTLSQTLVEKEQQRQRQREDIQERRLREQQRQQQQEQQEEGQQQQQQQHSSGNLTDTNTTDGTSQWDNGFIAFDSFEHGSGIQRPAERSAEIGESFLGRNLDSELFDRDTRSDDNEEGNETANLIPSRYQSSYLEARNDDNDDDDDDDDSAPSEEDSRFFMASEEYETERGDPNHSHDNHRSVQFIGSSSFTTGQQREPVSGEISDTQDALAGHSSLLVTSAATTGPSTGRSIQVDQSTTAITSPPEKNIEMDNSDHDMTVE